MSKLFNFSNIRIAALSVVAMFFFWMNGSAQCKDFTISVKGDTLNCTDVKDLKQGKWVVRY
ncbi:MAG TPA: hypothetical protein VL946_04500, partial [Lacibacter sp.]|nr:hypothetical protein [Lacibacter sp.]